MTQLKTLTAGITAATDANDPGGFVACASSPNVDRDGERLLAGCFVPLPQTVPVHCDHRMDAGKVVARGVPFYRDNDLLISATFSSSPEAQSVRKKVSEGLLDSVSVAFRGLQWETIAGVRSLVRGELLACDLVSIPSNAAARVMSFRNFAARSRGDIRREADQVINGARWELAMADLREAERFLRSLSRPPGLLRRQTDGVIAQVLRGGWPQ